MQVLVLMAACGNPPVPIRLVARVLGVNPEISSAALQSVRSSVLLYQPKRSPFPVRGGGGGEGGGGGGGGGGREDGGMECVSLYRGTRDVLRWLFLGNSVLRTGAAIVHHPSPTLPTSYPYLIFFSVKTTVWRDNFVGAKFCMTDCF